MATAAVAFGFVGLGVTGCNKSETAGTKYTCPMHPEVVADNPGTCPKCNMTLEVKK
jgi:hypothetical protein